MQVGPTHFSNIQNSFRDLLKSFLTEIEVEDHSIGAELDLNDVTISPFSYIKNDVKNRIEVEFISYNQRKYPQNLTVDQFIHTFSNGVTNKCNTLKKYIHFEYLYGIPVIVVNKSEFEEFYNRDDVGGLHHPNIGIFVVEGSNADFSLSHEIQHSFIDFLKSKKIFKQTKSIFGTQTEFFQTFDLMRNESIAYLLCNPKRLNSFTFEHACQAMAQQKPENLSDQIKSIIRAVQNVDSGNTVLTRGQMILAMLNGLDPDTLIQLINDLNKTKKS